jgi:hypothetical protein
MKKDETGGASSTYGGDEKCKQGSGGGNLKERGHLEDLRTDARIILK